MGSAILYTEVFSFQGVEIDGFHYTYNGGVLILRRLE